MTPIVVERIKRTALGLPDVLFAAYLGDHPAPSSVEVVLHWWTEGDAVPVHESEQVPLDPSTAVTTTLRVIELATRHLQAFRASVAGP